MKNKFYLLVALIGLFQVLSCKKDSQPEQQIQPQSHTLENGLVNFSINGELLGATIDTTYNTVTVVIPDSVNEKNLTATISLASQVNATLNGIAVNSSIVFDFSKPVVLTVTSSDKKRSTSFTVIIQPELQYFGLAGNVVAAKSLNKNYNFYMDQFDGSTFQSINCGPTVTTMAIKWANPAFTKTPVDARNQLESQGGWWFTGDVQSYLVSNGISNAVDTLSNLDSLVKKNIDNNRLLILCLDMSYVPQDEVSYQHIQKFYVANTTGWGHFLLVKGYKQTDQGHTFYLEIYDPYSDGEQYSGLDIGQLKGKDRYYMSYDIRIATKFWWPYAIIVAQKGQKVTASTHLQLNSAGKPKPIPMAKGR